MFRRPLLIAALFLSAAGLAACQSSEKAATTVQSAVQAQTTPTLSTTDATFINTVGAGGLAEVKFGQLAKDRATRSDVRDFAAKMVDDHTTAANELTSIARMKQMTPPDEIDLNHRAAYDRLTNTYGTEFDRVYIEGQVADHTATVAAFQDEISNGSDADVKGFAEKYLPTIQHHLEMARQLQSSF